MPSITLRLPFTAGDARRELGEKIYRLREQADSLESQLYEAILNDDQINAARSMLSAEYSYRRASKGNLRVESYTYNEAYVSVSFDLLDNDGEPIPAPSAKPAAPSDPEKAKRDELRRMLEMAPEKVVNLLLNHVADKGERRAILGIMFPGLWQAVSPPTPTLISEAMPPDAFPMDPLGMVYPAPPITSSTEY